MKGLTKEERSWVLYDIGNSAFVMLASTLIPIYYKNIAAAAGVAASDSTAYFSYATSIVTIIVAFLGPVLGSIADLKNMKKPVFTFFLTVGVLGCGALSVPAGWLAFLVIFIIAKVGYNGSLVFYDAMLNDITDEERIDMVSSQGYAWGYIGSCIPFIASLVFVLCSEQLGIGMGTAFTIAFCINAVWWTVMTLPLLKNYRQKYFIEHTGNIVGGSFSRIGKVLREIKEQKQIFWFLIAFFFYIDGVYTIIDMATSYGKDVGIGDTDLVLALLLTQIVAFPCSILFGKLAKIMKNEKLISISIIGYLGIALFAIQLDKAWEFWFLAVCVAVFQGGIQALSRSYFAKIIPKEKSTEYFGFYDIFGKGAAFLGTMMMGIATQLFDTSKAGVWIIAVMFCIGFVFFRRAVKYS